MRGFGGISRWVFVRLLEQYVLIVILCDKKSCHVKLCFDSNSVLSVLSEFCVVEGRGVYRMDMEKVDMRMK